MRKRLAQNLPFLRGLLTLLSRVVSSPISSRVCSCWVLGRCPPLPNPTKLCNTSPTEQPVVTASRDLAAGNQGGSLPTPSPPAQHLTDGDPTHLSLRRDVASAGRASASLQAPTSVMLFWDKLQGCNRGGLRAKPECPYPPALMPQARAELGTSASSQGGPGQQMQDRAVGAELCEGHCG